MLPNARTFYDIRRLGVQSEEHLKLTASGSTIDGINHAAPKNFRILVLGAIGVVYGDIGTSPIYAFREALHASSRSSDATITEVLGLLSLIVWALTIVVAVKYVGFVLKADNKGRAVHSR